VNGQTNRASNGPARRAAAAAAAATFALLLLTAGCNTGDPEDTLGTVVGTTATARFVAAEKNPGCARADLLSMQPGPSSGSTVNVNIVLTDCDASLTVSGVSFEVSFDPSEVDFIGCSPGTFFNASNLAPGTPVCKLSAPGNLLGSIALATPVGVTVPAPGTATVVRMAFGVKKQGANSAATFVGIDSLTSTSVFLINSSGGNIVVYSLGPSGYAGGNFVSN